MYPDWSSEEKTLFQMALRLLPDQLAQAILELADLYRQKDDDSLWLGDEEVLTAVAEQLLQSQKLPSSPRKSLQKALKQLKWWFLSDKEINALPD